MRAGLQRLVLGGLLAAAPALVWAQDQLAYEAYLAAELKLAQEQKFYIVFDPQVPELQLRLAGVVVHRFGLTSASIGQPRLQGGREAVWPAVQFTLANELPMPDRPQVNPEKGKEGAAQASEPQGDSSSDGSAGQTTADGSSQVKTPPVPKLALSLEEYRKETYKKIPTVYRLLFEPGLDVVVRGEPGAEDWRSRWRRFSWKMDEGWNGFARWMQDRPQTTRLVFYMDTREAQRLYMVLDPKIPFLIRVVPAGPK